MEEIRVIQKKYCSQALILAIAVTLICIIIGEKPVGKGYLLGTLFSILNFIIMGQSLPQRIEKSISKKSANLFAFTSIVLRFALLAVPLIISLKLDSINFFGVVIGLFAIQLTILFNQLIIDRLYLKKKA